MKKAIAAFVAALLCLAVLGGCGGGAGTPGPDAPTTDATTHFKDVVPPHRLLPYKMDENGIFYMSEQAWPGPLDQTIYSTVCVKFRYEYKDWLIQMWKGSYGLVMLGCEIAAEPETALVLQMDLYQKNFQANQIKHLFTRGPESAGWFNGFVPGKFYEESKKSEIIMVGSIEFPDEEMLRAFEASFAKAGFGKGTPSQHSPEIYAIHENTLTFSWQYIDQDA